MYQLNISVDSTDVPDHSTAGLNNIGCVAMVFHQFSLKSRNNYG